MLTDTAYLASSYRRSWRQVVTALRIRARDSRPIFKAGEFVVTGLITLIMVIVWRGTASPPKKFQPCPWELGDIRASLLEG